MKQIITLFTFALFFLCNAQAQVPSGTYVPKNDIANATQFTKFEFTGGKNVKVHFGMSGISIGAYEYIYTLNGSSLSLSEAGKNGSVEFTYNKATDEISLAAGLYGSEGAVWKKDGAANNSVTTNTAEPAKQGSTASVQSLKGTYLPVNEVAEMSNFTKFEFTSGNKAKIYYGMNGASIASYDYIYTLNGNNLSFFEEGKNGSVEFTYDKAKDQILLAAGFYGSDGAKWGREGKTDCSFLATPQVDCAPKVAAAGSKYIFRWKPVQCATEYKISWSFHGEDGLRKKGYPMETRVTKNEYTIMSLPDERGVMKITIYALDAYKESKEPLEVTVEVMKNEGIGKLIFLTHGLEDSHICFKETVRLLDYYNNYLDLGYVTMRDNRTNPTINPDWTCLNYANFINDMVKKGINVMIRIEFSSGTLSFDNQLKEMDKMINMFKGHNAEVVLVGHSMGGLASINYAIVHKGTKIVKIITVDTPFHPNNYAKYVWGGENPGMFTGTRSLISQVLSNQIRGEAHRDLGGFSDGNGKYVLSDLRDNWNKYTGIAKLHAISVSMYKKNANSSDIGDGVVDLPSQRGEKDKKDKWEWYNTNPVETIYGTGQSTSGLPLEGLNDRSNPYHHINTPKLPEVIRLISDIIDGEIFPK